MTVDDDDTITGLIKMIFGYKEDEEDQYEIVECYDPENALLEFPKKKPTIVIADFRMDKMTGLEMAIKMREINPKIKVVFVSGLKEHAEICKKNGFEHFLLKPSFINPLRKIIKDFLSG